MLKTVMGKGYCCYKRHEGGGYVNTEGGGMEIKTDRGKRSVVKKDMGGGGGWG